jgi:hypothetical protein
MSIRASLRVALALLVAAVQVAGAGIATAPTRTPDRGAYFCCCVGECSCTGDCCNHGPADDDREKASNIRIGAGGPALEAPKSCGMWRATMQRGPDEGKAIVDNSGTRSAAPPASPRPHQFQKTPFVSSDEGLRPSSPRAPPSPTVRT